MNCPISTSGIPAPTPEERRRAALHFDRANQFIATGTYRPGIDLLVECCRLDPANLLYRQSLRRTEKARFGNHPPRTWLAWLFSWPKWARLRAAQRAGRYLEVLHIGERFLVHDPWHILAQREMAFAAEFLGQIDLAVWLLEQARHKEPNDRESNRRLARLYERRGNFQQAQALWHRVLDLAPEDEEARQKQFATSMPAPTEGLEEHLGAARASIQNDPTAIAGYLHLARSYRNAGRFEEARTTLVTGLAATANAFELTVEFATLEIESLQQDLNLTRQRLVSGLPDLELQRIERALEREILTRELELYRTLADRYPRRLDYRYEVGIRLLQSGRIAEAVEELQALRGDPGLGGPALLALGRGFRSFQNYAHALRHFEDALASTGPAMTPLHQQALFEIARCHADLGNLERAIAVGTELARLEPQNAEVASLMADWQTRTRQAS